MNLNEVMDLRVLPLYTSSENLIPSPCLIRRTSLSMVKASMSKWAFSRIVPPGVSYIPDETQRNAFLYKPVRLNAARHHFEDFFVCRLTPLRAPNHVFLSNTRKWSRQFSVNFARTKRSIIIIPIRGNSTAASAEALMQLRAA